MPADYLDARDYVAIRPMPSPSHVGLKVTTRCSTPVYTCEIPSRKRVAKNNYERRDHQINQCGYRSVNFKPYKEVGEVVLDDRELILRALGQFDGDNISEDNSEDEEVLSRLSQSQTVTLSKEESAQIIQQQKVDNLQTVSQQISHGRHLLNKVKLGIGLFKLIREERDRKAYELELRRIENEEKSKRLMKAPNSATSSDADSEEISLSRYLVPSPTRIIHRDSGNEAENELKLRRKSLDARTSNSSLKETHRTAFVPEEKQGSSEPTDIPIKIEEKARDRPETSSQIDQKEGISDKDIVADVGRKQERHQKKKLTYAIDLENDTNSTLHLQPHHQRQESSNAAKAKVSKSKIYKRSIPRPFSPVFTNVNFYETESREYTFRQLCAIHWILEAMSQDQPVSMPPISSCWQLRDLKEDRQTAQWKVEREKAVDPIWKSFLTNPKKFTRGRTGRRGTLLQRRVSIAPNTIHKMSISSTSTLPGTKFLSPNEDNVYSPRGRSNTATSMSSKRSDHSPESDVSARGARSRRSTMAPVAEVSGLQQSAINPHSFKEKAFTVKEVIVSKNAFARRGSKRGKARSPSLVQREKTSTEKMKPNSKNEIKEEIDEDEETDTSSLKKASPSKQKFVAAAIATFGAISANSKAHKLPKECKEKFEVVAAESALVLHDNLEQRERKSIASMERKFFALHVMSDVNKAINIMRSRSRLRDETDEEKKARFSEECSWYKSLLENLPLDIREDRNNALVLDKIAKYGSLEGRKISSNQFTKVLSMLRPWELCYPDISAAIEFVRDKIVEMDRTEFEDWFQSRGSILWNALPDEIKSSQSIASFKIHFKQWNGDSCNCNIYATGNHRLLRNERSKAKTAIIHVCSQSFVQKKGCDLSLSSSTGNFTSPGYPSKYLTSKQCKYSITVPVGKTIQLDFISFNLGQLGCVYAELKVYEGTSAVGTPVLTKCGTSRDSFISESNQLYFAFKATLMTTPGFHIKYSARDSCNMIFDSSQGTFVSPKYSLNYPDSKTCAYKILGPSGSRMHLIFSVFTLEESSSCSKDSLSIYEGSDTSGTLAAVKCGRNTTQYLSKGNSLFLQFKSDASINEQGFRIYYFTGDEGCDKILTATTGNITSPAFPSSYPNNAYCTYKITSPEGTSVQLKFRSFFLPGYGDMDRLKIYEGKDSTGLLTEQRTWGITYPYLSTGNNLFLVFETDSTGTANGFDLEYSSVIGKKV
eukprot:Seg778.1 transcript_id=Seg778.1/GoldUCD/mRNA.D3Y31 product="Deleted in malignant brain tumors 1 protein" protein_id=Seg778.1/GoldUCD/D3Y31